MEEKSSTINKKSARGKKVRNQIIIDYFLNKKIKLAGMERNNLENLFKPDLLNLIKLQGTARQRQYAAIRRLEKKIIKEAFASKICTEKFIKGKKICEI